jgi:hypothetical protein
MQKFLLFLAVFGACTAFMPASTGSGSEESTYFVVGNSREKFDAIYGKSTSTGYFYYEELTRQLLPEFRGLPYGAGGVACPSKKTLVNLTSFDCVTLVETFWSMSYTQYQIQSGQVPAKTDPFEVFANNLDRIRYFGGENCGIEQRIHYFTQQMLEMERAGLVFNVAAANGEPFRKKINYISTNPTKYGTYGTCPELKNAEAILNSSFNYYYPLSKVDQHYLPLAKTGDIVAFATNEPGLDVSHTGIITVEDGEVLFTHASSQYDKVVHGQDLKDYLASRTKCTGIFIFRPVFGE